VRTLAGALLVMTIVLASPGCEALGRPMIVDECGRVIQTSRFLKCFEVVAAKEPCPPGVVKQTVTAPCCDYADLALMEGILRDSGLDWTVVRPPRLTDGPVTGTYRTAYEQNLRGGLVVSRADVAHFMLRVLDEPETIRKAIGIAS
jgi:hypothetical protein